MTTAQLLRVLVDRGLVGDRPELVEALLGLERTGYVASTYGPQAELTFALTAEGSTSRRAEGLTSVQAAVLDVLRAAGKPPGDPKRKRRE